MAYQVKYNDYLSVSPAITGWNLETFRTLCENEPLKLEYDETSPMLSLIMPEEFLVSEIKAELERWIVDFFDPLEYTLDGVIAWQGDHWEDVGQIIVEKNKVEVRHGLYHPEALRSAPTEELLAELENRGITDKEIRRLVRERERHMPKRRAANRREDHCSVLSRGNRMQKGEKKYPVQLHLLIDSSQLKKLDTLSKKQGLRSRHTSAG